MGIIVISIYRGFIKKMKVWNLDVIWQCWSYLQICVFVSNIGSVHYLEMPASLWGGTVSAPFIPHSFNGGSKSHISREQDFSPLSIFKSIFTVSTEAAKVTFRERLQNLTTEILLLAPSVVVQTELVWRMCCYIWREIYFTNPCAVALSSHVYPFKRGALKYLLFWIAPSLYI